MWNTKICRDYFPKWDNNNFKFCFVPNINVQISVLWYTFCGKGRILMKDTKILGIRTMDYTILWIHTLKRDKQHLVLYIMYLWTAVMQFALQCKECYTLIINSENLSLGNSCTSSVVVQTAGGLLGEPVFRHCSPCRTLSLTRHQQVLLCVPCRKNRKNMLVGNGQTQLRGELCSKCPLEGLSRKFLTKPCQN